MTQSLRIDFVSDIACPWCAIGLASLMQPLERGEVHAELRGELFGILELARPDPNEHPDDVMTKGASVPATSFIINQ